MASTNRAGVPNQMGGYDYSTDGSQNVLFNQGYSKAGKNAAANPNQTGGYDYSAKSGAARMYRMRGLSPSTTAATPYGAKINADKMYNRQNTATNRGIHNV